MYMINIINQKRKRANKEEEEDGRVVYLQVKTISFCVGFKNLRTILLKIPWELPETEYLVPYPIFTPQKFVLKKRKKGKKVRPCVPSMCPRPNDIIKHLNLHTS